MGKAITLGRNRLDLYQRLREVSLDLSIYQKVPSKFIRINPRKKKSIEKLALQLKQEYGVETIFQETGVPGIYRSTSNDIGGLVVGKQNELFNRHYFIQDLASVVCVQELELQEGQTLLETCAARGFKSILAHDLMKGNIQITALDIDPEKYQKMLYFFEKFGLRAETYLTDATQFIGKKYDRVLVDAPCSSEGMTVVYNSDLKMDVSGFEQVLQYSAEDITNLCLLQGKLLQNGYNHLNDNGILIYATCTLNKQENEEVIAYFLERNKDAVIIQPAIDKYKITAAVSDLGVRILPGDTKGFYFSKIKKSK